MKIAESMWPVLVAVLVVCGAALPLVKGDGGGEFSYVVGSARGPSRWGSLHPEWALCSNGTMQSPIELPPLRPQPAPISERVNYFYSPANATLRNRGHDIELIWAVGASRIRINGEDYVLKQLHWHTPSEHTISATRYAMEVHLVHQTAQNKTAVVGVLYSLGQPDPLLARLVDKIRSISDSSQEIEAGVVNPTQIIMGRGTTYYRYMGSFTTPPCTQGVIWTVDTKIGTVSQEQLNVLRQAVDDDAVENARPLQPRNERSINLYYNHHY